MNSMTGFGSVDLTTGSGVEIHIDIASYNKKQLDIRASIPSEIASLEPSLRKIVNSRIFRGSVTIRIELSFSPSSVNPLFECNHNLAAAYVKSARKLQKRLKLSGDIDVNEVLKIPGVISQDNIASLVTEEELENVANKAIDKLIIMRREEGKALKKDIKSRVDLLSEILKKIVPLTGELHDVHRERLLNNLKNEKLEISPDDERVLKEVVIYIDRSDVSEEVTRIKSHIVQFNKHLTSKEPVGRAMEFLIQELQREINTLGTKAANTGISPLVIQFKTELEKIREQVQNVE